MEKLWICYFSENFICIYPLPIVPECGISKNLTCCFSNWGAMLRSLEHSWRSLTRSSMVETTSSNWTLVFRIPSACFSYRSRYSLTRACAVKLVSQKRIESLATRNSRAYWKKDTNQWKRLKKIISDKFVRFALNEKFDNNRN